jgi:hypothetical protein
MNDILDYLLDFIASLSEEFRSGEKYEKMIDSLEIDKKEIQKIVKRYGKSKIKEENVAKEKKKHENGYRAMAISILYGFFPKQTQKYINEVYNLYDNFTEAYNNLKSGKDLFGNKHPETGKRVLNTEIIFTLHSVELANELTNLGIKFTNAKTKEKIDEETKKFYRERYAEEERQREEINRKNEEYARRFEEGRKKSEEMFKKFREDTERRKREEEERRREEERKRNEQAKYETQSTEEVKDPKYVPRIGDYSIALKFFEITKTYGMEDLNRARKRKALLFHPDKSTGNHNQFVKMEEYYTLLKWFISNPKSVPV